MKTKDKVERNTVKKIRKWYKQELKAEAIKTNNEVWQNLYDDLQKRHKLMIKICMALVIVSAVNITALIILWR